MELGQRVTLAQMRTVVDGGPVSVPDAVIARLAADRRVVDHAAAGPDPVYGLNTGLGANLGHRIAPEDIPAFQQQILDGRAVATGEPLPASIGSGVLAARLVSAARGGSGVSVPMFLHMLDCLRAGVDPVIPEYGSIGASDLTQNAVWARALLGQGMCWRSGVQVPAQTVLAEAGLTPPPMQPKDAMALINHGGLTVALAGEALDTAGMSLAAQKVAVLLSFAGFDANRDILTADVNNLRVSPGQADFAAWLRNALDGTAHNPRRVQDALSFRTVAPVVGAALDAWDRSVTIWEDELNGLQDSPAVFGDDAMRSTPNFVAPALTLALENLCLANAMIAGPTVQRMQRMMDPSLSGLPRYLTPEEGASAGYVPLQKTAAALLAEIRALATPVRFDTAPVSQSVEDFAAETMAPARRLARQAVVLEELSALEAIVAAQAVELRELESMSATLVAALDAVRGVVPALSHDRPLGADTAKLRTRLRDLKL
ncbi:MAG: aromatic amino acid lyase [Paracoccaceae bacterium]